MGATLPEAIGIIWAFGKTCEDYHGNTVQKNVL